jgi:phospholipid-binding lipoprotein MlaA
MRRTWLVALLLASAVARAEEDRDPWEGFNRGVFSFNETIDEWVLEPVARGYDTVMPNPLQTCVSNFFRNLQAPISSVNNLLQGKPKGAATEVGRFTTNVVLGLAGFLDPATYFGLERRDEDFGQTLGVWGLSQGPYLVLPLLGPSTVRDTGGLMVDSAMNPSWYYLRTAVTVGSRIVNTVNARSLVLKEVEDAREASLDFYVFVRDAYLQHREAEVSDHGEVEREVDDSLYYPEAEPAR